MAIGSICLIKLHSMNIEEIHEYCITIRGITESLPVNDTALAL
jgi:hypothetical protein